MAWSRPEIISGVTRGTKEFFDKILDGVGMALSDVETVSLEQSAVAGSFVIAAPHAFPGLDPTGATDSSAAFQAAINATPDGARLIVPAGVYKLDSGVAITDRTLTIESYGVTYTKATDG
ncbi:glycoside hydrolase family 55 protein, partial [Prescottella equi]|uniref:glycoside hydrolase family 55 protein n=1 Tax=Rhodococcus hoagii TaxID=43767 RepID=UPI0021D4F5C2